MKLRDVLTGIDFELLTGSLEIEVRGLSYGSDNIEEGFMFTAIRGERTDGHLFIPQACENGANSLLVERLPKRLMKTLGGGVAVVKVHDTKKALALAASNFFGNPTGEITLVGVTGTNGKTTFAYLLESIWKAGGRNTGMLGTVETRYGDKVVPSSLTTPESVDLMRTFREMADYGVDCAVMEVSSHSMSRKRVDGCLFDAAVFTNLTQDHLDYHGAMENYFLEKKRLFTELMSASDKQPKFAIVNIDDPYGRIIASDAPCDVVGYSLEDKNAQCYCSDIVIDAAGIRAKIHSPWGEANIQMGLFGAHNLYNALSAAACALALGSSPKDVEQGLRNTVNVPGRLERIGNDRGINVLVDYAHTPDALENVLKSIKPLTKGKLILVFGCGGDRDQGKRPLMGSIGRQLSDILIVTSDNPRTEDPENIIDHIEAGFMGKERNKRPYHRISDRAEAITKAIALSSPDDTVLIAGKGHEDYQIIGTKKYPFDDRAVAKAVLNED